MVQNLFRLEVTLNKGKSMKMPYDKRFINNHVFRNPKMIDTFSHGPLGITDLLILRTSNIQVPNNSHKALQV